MTNVNKEELKAAYIKSARIVEIYGDRYLPIFLRLEAEMQKVANQEAAAERVRRVLQEQEAA